MTDRPGALSFDDYLARHGAALHRYAYVLTGSADDAQDVVQAALIKAYRRWRRIGRMASPHGYVRRIVTHCFVDQRRRRSAAERPTDEFPESPDPSDIAERAADVDAVVRALAVLTPQQRAVLVLRHLLDLADDDIAGELGCSAATVRSHASRGLQRLRASLSYPDLEIDHG